jgi:Domain of unknown function (DUF5606)
MTLKDVVAIAGKPGLYKVLKPTRTGMIVEAFGDKASKLVINASHKVSVLKEISIYVQGSEDSIPLIQALLSINTKYPEAISIDTKDAGALTRFMEDVVPEYDREKVYTSDMKKLVNWYNLLIQHCPEVLVAEEEAPAQEAEKSETTSAE